MKINSILILKLQSDNVLEDNKKPINSLGIIKKISLKDKNNEKDIENRNYQDEINENKKFAKNFNQKKEIDNKKKNLNNFINYHYFCKGSQIIKYYLIYILLYHLYLIYSQINCSFKSIKFYSYEITLKVNGTGIKNILSDSSFYTYPCPTYLYLNGDLIQDNTDCRNINITELDSIIKLIWNNNISTTNGMFYNCTEITEIDMTNFDTSSVTDMNEMFSMCSSLKSLKVSNLNTESVISFENMFCNCTSLKSLNLESFTNPSAISLYRMFYNCENLEYINIKNFEEKENLNIDEMFYNISQNAVICLLSCPPPTNLTLTSITESQAEISWDGYEWNNYIISYNLQGFSNQEDGTILNVSDTTHYTFTDLNPGERYDIYIKTDCGGKYSYWLGPLLLSIESYNMPNSGSNRINTCSKVIYDSGGAYGNYEKNANSYLFIYPELPGKPLTIKGIIRTRSYHGHVSIFKDGTWGTRYSGNFDIPLSVATDNHILLKLVSDDYSTTREGFRFTIGCMLKSPQTIYNLIKDNTCRRLSCDNDYKNIQNIILSNSGLCLKNCNSTNLKYHYRGNCYNSCPDNSTNQNFICYSNNILEKCGEYSLESDYENLCIKCNNDYYPILNDANNKYNFIECYKKNSLEKYYLDNIDLLFKPCYESCKTCNKNGTKENHNCITCDDNNEFNFTFGENYNCYPKCDNYYYFDKEKNYICLDKKECSDDYIYLIEDKNQCLSNCKEYPYFLYEFQKKCYDSCPENISEISKERENYCEIKCPKEMPYELIENQKCVNNCTITQINKKLCKINFISENKSEKNEAQEKMVEDIQGEITNGIDTSGIDSGEDIIIQEKDVTVTITKNDNQKNEISSKTNTTSIDLGECETKLKNKYNISQNESLYILKMDIKQEGYKIPKIQYEVYYDLNHDSKLCLLNLSVCENTNIDIYLPLTLNGNLEQYDPNSDFYNDICATYTSENGTDLTLSDRKNNYINNNLAICEESCTFIQYNESIGKAVCSCKTKTDFANKISENGINKEDLLKNFADFNNIFNVKILKCVSQIFSGKAFKENYANITLIFLILIYFLCLFLFICNYKNEIIFYIDIIIYFTLFQFKILYIIQKKEREERNKSLYYNLINGLNNNIHIEFRQRIILRKIKKIKKNRKVKPKKLVPNLEELFSSKRILETKNIAQEKMIHPNITKNEKPLNPKKMKNRIKIKNEIKLEEKNNEKYSDIVRKFSDITEEQIYEIYKKIYFRTENELNDLSYIDALKYDNRTYLEFYFSLVKSNHLLFFSFLQKFDFNSRIIKIYLFFFNFATLFFVNALFFTDKTMGKINNDGGNFNFIYNLPQIIYSSIISTFIYEFIKIFALTENSFIQFRNNAKKKRILKLFKTASNLKINFKIKFIIFFILDFLLLVFFWIYLSSFSAVYHNTQIHLIKDTLISFGTSLITPFALYLFPGIFRIPALKSNNRIIMYKIYKIIQLLL